MDAKEALRKVELLRRITPDRGASAGDVATASRLVSELMKRYGLGQYEGTGLQTEAECNRFGQYEKAELRTEVRPQQSPTWSCWQQLANGLDLNLRCFGGRASVELWNGERLIIRLDGGRWHVERRSSQGWQQLAKGTGVEAALHYLTKLAPRRYTFLHS